MERYTYQNLVEALADLKKRGYTEDFNLKPFCIECPRLKLIIGPEHFQVEELYRFEGMSNPDDNSVVYAISSDLQLKGVLVDAYGVYADALTPEMASKLR